MLLLLLLLLKMMMMMMMMMATTMIMMMTARTITTIIISMAPFLSVRGANNTLQTITASDPLIHNLSLNPLPFPNLSSTTHVPFLSFTTFWHSRNFPV